MEKTVIKAKLKQESFRPNRSPIWDRGRHFSNNSLKNILLQTFSGSWMRGLGLAWRRLCAWWSEASPTTALRGRLIEFRFQSLDFFLALDSRTRGTGAGQGSKIECIGSWPIFAHEILGFRDIRPQPRLQKRVERRIAKKFSWLRFSLSCLDRCIAKTKGEEKKAQKDAQKGPTPSHRLATRP